MKVSEEERAGGIVVPTRGVYGVRVNTESRDVNRIGVDPMRETISVRIIHGSKSKYEFRVESHLRKGLVGHKFRRNREPIMEWD